MLQAGLEPAQRALSTHGLCHLGYRSLMNNKDHRGTRTRMFRPCRPAPCRSAMWSTIPQKRIGNTKARRHEEMQRTEHSDRGFLISSSCLRAFVFHFFFKPRVTEAAGFEPASGVVCAADIPDRYPAPMGSAL